MQEILIHAVVIKCVRVPENKKYLSLGSNGNYQVGSDEYSSIRISR